MTQLDFRLAWEKRNLFPPLCSSCNQRGKQIRRKSKICFSCFSGVIISRVFLRWIRGKHIWKMQCLIEVYMRWAAALSRFFRLIYSFIFFTTTFHWIGNSRFRSDWYCSKISFFLYKPKLQMWLTFTRLHNKTWKRDMKLMIWSCFSSNNLLFTLFA